jgi:AAA15 family ATPase/GTPase
VRKIEVRSFSCIDHALLEIRDLTVIIGPQASGKSVLCKLFYFFNSTLDDLTQWVTEPGGANNISRRFLEEFCEWFQPQTWGPRAFSITYSSGPFEITISRGRSKSHSSKAKVKFSHAIEQLISIALMTHAKAIDQVKDDPDKDFEMTWRTFSLIRRAAEKMLGVHAPEEQLYIPAGRSFFTSVGKIVTAFEDRTLLDPVVTRFGRIVTAIREDISFDKMQQNPILKTIEDLIDGRIVHDRGRQWLSTPDGRNIPFSALSSGQQELLPLLYGLRYSLSYRTGRERGHLLYIEEPEAHLFPTAQTALVEMFAQMTSRAKSKNNKVNENSTRIILTTHSPYVLAKINNLIKAGSLSAKLNLEKRRDLERKIPSSSWIQPNNVAAYAIHQRRLVSITDDYGLIDGEYIDSVSSATGEEFDAMLDMEASL